MHGMRSLGFHWSCADNLGVLARGANNNNVHLARLIAGVKRAGLDVHDTSHASGSADVLGDEVSPVNLYCSGTGKRLSRLRSVARTVSTRRRISGRAMELVNGHEYFLALGNRGTLSIFDASFKFAWASAIWQHGSHGQPHAWNRASVRMLSPPHLAVCAGLMSASVRMRQKKVSRSLFVRYVLNWPRKSVVSRSGQGTRDVPSPSVPGRMPSVPSRKMSTWTIQVRTKRGSLARE